MMRFSRPGWVPSGLACQGRRLSGKSCPGCQDEERTVASITPAGYSRPWSRDRRGGDVEGCLGVPDPNRDSGGLADESPQNHGLGQVYQVDHECLRLTWVNPEAPVYQCGICRRVRRSPYGESVRRWGVRVHLRFVPPTEQDRDHYRTLYRSMNAVPMTAKEHTAQWVNTEAAAIQHQFVRGEINALSCSTTFELGVDVGELQAVMLRNMPPSTANYLQRAGRAGRRSGAAALVVTYAMRRSHDLTKFNEPEVMIAGQVRAPYVPLTNARIDRRHAQSVAMAAFFRWLFETTGRIDRKAGEFFLHQDGNEPSVSLVSGFLTPVPPEITEALTRILPSDVAAELDLAAVTGQSCSLNILNACAESWTTKSTQCGSWSRGHLPKASIRWLSATSASGRRYASGTCSASSPIEISCLSMDFLSTLSNCEPTLVPANRKGGLLDLSRDLSQAIYEYAPDAEIVAGGNLWVSRGIYRLPGRDLLEYYYHVCKRCGGFRYGIESADEKCQYCGEVAQTAVRRLTIPEFGFVAAPDPGKPGPRPPRRTWSGDVHVLSQPPEVRSYTKQLRGGSIVVSAGPRGQLIAVADGPNKMGFWICDWCGHGSQRVKSPQKPPKHNHLLKNQPCAGPQRLLDLAHSYETDLLSIDVDVFGHSPNEVGLAVGDVRHRGSCVGDAGDSARGHRRFADARRCGPLVDHAIRRCARRRRTRAPG